MRRLSLSLFTGALLLTTTARPAHAEDFMKRYMDCVKFAATWYEIAHDEADNFLERWATEVGYAYLLLRCGVAPDAR
jgi:hypothetical protein